MFCKICGDIFRKESKDKAVCTFHRFYQTHYEVLHVKRNCTPKEIKTAFIKLSKEHHPDVNKSKQSHKRFLKINEAYKVLSKPKSREQYDLGLGQPQPVQPRYYYEANSRTEIFNERMRRNPYKDPSFWVNRDKSRDEFYRNEPYYGIDGIPRLSNGIIVTVCVFFTLIGIGVQYYTIVHSSTFKRHELLKRSLETENILNEAKQVAQSSGNEAQLKALKIKLLGNVENECDNK